MRPPLHAVTPDEPAPSVSDRIRALQSEAQALARDHLRAFMDRITELEATAKEIAEGGGAYHDGAQERVRRIGMELTSQRETLEQIVGRAR